MQISSGSSSVVANEVDQDNFSFSTRIWRESKREITFSIFSPFLVSMAANNLPQEANEHYLTQDLHYLKAYREGCQICMDNTDDDELRQMFRELSSSAQEEEAIAKLGMRRGEGSQICPATQNYIDFLLDTAKGTVKELEHLSIDNTELPNFFLCAITPCSRVYYVAGTELRDSMVLPNQYQDWIVNNASDKYKEQVAKIERLVDKVYKDMNSDNKRDAAEKLYKHGMKNEIKFFQSNPLLNRDKVVVPLCERLKSVNGKLKLSVYGNAILAGDTYVTSSLMVDDLFQHVLKYACHFSLNQEGGILTSETLQTAIKSMEDMKKKVTTAAQQEVILQRYGINLFSEVLKNTEEYISILVNPSQGSLESTKFGANEPNKADAKVLTAYIGSSEDELTNLLKADIGIVVEQNNEELRSEGSRNSVSFVPLLKGLVTYQSHFDGTLFPWKKPSPPVVYTVSSWAEIDAFILRSSEDAIDC